MGRADAQTARFPEHDEGDEKEGTRSSQSLSRDGTMTSILK
jgi:hypothetical protein